MGRGTTLLHCAAWTTVDALKLMVPKEKHDTLQHFYTQVQKCINLCVFGTALGTFHKQANKQENHHP